MVIDAVENFLRGLEWRQTMNTFINGHCAMFAVINGEHGHGQFEVFSHFRDTVEGLLDGVLSSIGCSEEAFIRGLKKREQQPEGGPRDAAINEMIRTLMTFERFAIFKVMMHKHNQKLTDIEMGGDGTGGGQSNDAAQTLRRETRDTRQHSSGSSASDRYQQRKQRSESKSEVNGWNCTSCSFFNEYPRESCEMCRTTHRPRRGVGNDAMQQQQQGDRGDHGSRGDRHDSSSSSSSSSSSGGRSEGGRGSESSWGGVSRYGVANSESTTLRLTPGSTPLKVPRPVLGRGRSRTGSGSGSTEGTSSSSSSRRRTNIRASERICPFQALCHENFVAAKQTEMSMKCGEMAIVIDNTSSVDWWYAECPTRGVKGWIPVTFLTVDEETEEDQETRLKTLSQSMRRGGGIGGGSGGGTGRRTAQEAEEEKENTMLAKKLQREKFSKVVLRKSSTCSVDEETFRTMMPVAEDRAIRSVFEEYDHSREKIFFLLSNIF